MERKPRPARHADRGPSPPGKLGAMDHGRRRRTRSRRPRQQAGDRGMLGCLRRRGARKMPKRLRALRFRTVGPSLHLGSRRRKTARASEANPLRSCRDGALPTARNLGETRGGVRDRQTQGDSRPREGHGISWRARRRSRGCARTLFVSLQKSTSGFGSEKPFPQNVIPRKRNGDRGGRGPGLRMYPIVPSRVRCHRRPGFPNEAFRCEATRGEGSRRRHENRFPAHGVRNTS